ncbi:hypothetical protein [Crossiella sp. NPDC003009]
MGEPKLAEADRVAAELRQAGTSDSLWSRRVPGMTRAGKGFFRVTTVNW